MIKAKILSSKNAGRCMACDRHMDKSGEVIPNLVSVITIGDPAGFSQTIRLCVECFDELLNVLKSSHPRL